MNIYLTNGAKTLEGERHYLRDWAERPGTPMRMSGKGTARKFASLDEAAAEAVKLQRLGVEVLIAVDEES